MIVFATMAVVFTKSNPITISSEFTSKVYYECSCGWGQPTPIKTNNTNISI